MSSRLQSSGRGGAGNIVDSSQQQKLTAQALETPTLKTAVVTTGRGGTGNMAKNTDPVETRLRQDVEPVIRRQSHGAQHVGRGGNGNVFNANSEDAAAANKEQDKASSAIDDDGTAVQPPRSPGWAEKGRNLIFGKK
ncbi:hypothetical protein B0H63DRAFT_517243 [Podospora didyma]|uniref:Uncharacterized protein n=1 Tax=Podospora didyma TaxID=330526 RepID=A0AAE0U7P2_9PEZI|nr:hypothetical protein B0H63DRAFT_517243 [Podospora didyma]